MICEKCGAESGRSYPQLKRFMALVQAAYDHWPEKNSFQPESAEHLRAWLIARAGFKETRTIKLGDVPLTSIQKDGLEVILAATLRAAGSWAFIDVQWGRILVHRPISMSYKTPHDVATAICNSVDEVIEIETGVPVERLLKATESAA